MPVTSSSFGEGGGRDVTSDETFPYDREMQLQLLCVVAKRLVFASVFALFFPSAVVRRVGTSPDSDSKTRRLGANFRDSARLGLES